MKKASLVAFLIPFLLFGQGMCSGLDFLKLGVGGKACAMGEAFISISDDGTAPYWNPAGLGNIEKKTVHFTHTEWFVDSRFEYISGVKPFDFGVVSSHITYLNSGEIEGRDEYGEITSPYDNTYISLGVSYGKKFARFLDFGFSLKYINEKIEESSGSGFAVDAGFLFITPFNINVGTVIQNMGTSVKLEEEESSLPMTFRFGLSYNKTFHNISMTPAFDLVVCDEVRENLGVEFIISDILSILGGYKMGFGQGCFTSGVGISHNTGSIELKISYAYNEFSDLGVGQRVSFEVGF